MKLVNYFLRRKIAKYEDLSLNTVKSQIIDSINKRRMYVNINNELRDSIFENILIKAINQRCQYLSNSNSFFNDKENMKVKLFGECNFILDNSNWVEVKKRGTLNEDLRLKQDLFFSESHIYQIINNHMEFFELNDKEIQRMILPLIKKSDLKSVKDLKELVNNITCSENEKSKI